MDCGGREVHRGADEDLSNLAELQDSPRYMRGRATGGDPFWFQETLLQRRGNHDVAIAKATIVAHVQHMFYYQSDIHAMSTQ